MGQFFKPVPVPSGVAFHRAQQHAAFSPCVSNVRMNPPFLSSSSIPSTLLNQAVARQNVAGKGRLNHVA
ncbi:hypothetical protein BS640_07470 [Rouxiella badensis]|jgi:hypothetical protein|uniref:Uncharacterized protein n=1 Tax=Rouxiella badensis TaxID=1646377 RepID=A0A1X0WHA7_9GAMM|nr:hypothetical protein BS640_07470 [Rouxiella badensis]